MSAEDNPADTPATQHARPTRHMAPERRLSRVYTMFLVSCAAGCIVTPLAIAALAVVTLPSRWSLAALAALAVLGLMPIAPRHKHPAITRFFTDVATAADSWFSLRVIYNKEKFTHAGPHVIGLEPHGVLPTALPTTCNNLIDRLPAAVGSCHALATSVVFHMPIMRHFWWYLDLRPASRAWFNKLLGEGHSVAISPGGVQECMHMGPGKEVAFVSKRLGFVRLALKHGAPLCPCFAFGQTDCFHYLRPGPPLFSRELVRSVARKVGFAPMLLWGKWGTTLPFDAPVTMVIGDPIALPRIEAPTDEEAQKYLDLYITGLRDIYYKYREEAGYPDQELEIL